MPHAAAVLGHIAVGTAAIIFYWATFASVKGSPRHRAWGKTFFVTMIIVAFSVGPVIALRPGDFDPAYVVQFVYLNLCMITVVAVGWTAIRFKSDVERFRGAHFKALGVAVFVLGLVVLGAGIANGNALTMIFSWVGLVYGGAMMRFAWMRSTPHPRWHLIWHLNAVSGLLNATLGTFLAVAWRMAVDSGAGDEVSIVTQLGTMAASLFMRLWFGARYDAPLRLTKPTQVTAGAPA